LRYDHYVIVDWSAANQPKTGRDSIWICHRGPDGERCENPATRHAAALLLSEVFAGVVARGERAVVGFDFPFGYPEGFAARLGLAGPPWRAVWDELARLIEDDDKNRSNRFAVGAALNQRVSNGRFPFWGCPTNKAGEFLGPKHHRLHASDPLEERRLIDKWMTGAQPCWKLAYTGSVGSQSLTGIPVVRRLRDDPRWADRARIWPFETGFDCPAHDAIVFAEVWPSWWRKEIAANGYGLPNDQAQVRTVAEIFAARDRAGELAAWFAGDPDLTANQRRVAETEEAWTLGVTARRLPARHGRNSAAAARYTYLRDPEAIYRRSFALVREEADLSRFSATLHPLSIRLAHAAGDVAILDNLAWSRGAATIAHRALAAGASVLVDSAMVAAGIARDRLPAANAVVWTVDDPEVPGMAANLATTRSAAAVELWRPHLAGAVVAIGNAPTALFHLLEMLAAGADRPAVILGFPVGFVGAAEAKEALISFGKGLPYVTLRGRRGGSALAAAAVNALAAEAGRKRRT
jgi:precorrin-8X/cobalt-precorrin-8 methylmutase